MKHPARLALAALALLAPARAAAIDRDACAVPYEEAQVLRKRRLFTAATEQLELCRAQCPAVLAADCTQWTSELKALTPTVACRVHDASGNAVVAFRVSVDGTLLSDSPGDAALPVDPGAHVFRIEGPGLTATEVRATLNEGEHRRILDVTVVPTVVAGPPPPPEKRSDPSPSRVPAYAFGSIGALGLLVGGGLSLGGFVDKAYLSGSCKPNCAPSSVDTIRTVWWAGGISGIVGALSFGTAILLWPRPHPVAGEVGVWWEPVVGVGSAGVVGRF